MSLYNTGVTPYELMRTFFPRWLLEFYEFDELIKMEAFVTENLQKAIDLLLDNRFIDTMDLPSVQRIEKLLNLNSDESKTIEERRNYIKLLFLGLGKMSMSQIIAIVETLCQGNCEGSFGVKDSTGNQYIKLSISNCDIKNSLLDIISTLKKRIPAHLWVEIYYTPKNINLKLNNNISAQTGLSSVCASFIPDKEQCIENLYIGVACHNAKNIVVLVTSDLIWGGCLDTEFVDELYGGTLSQVFND